MKKYLGFLTIGAMLFATACSASVDSDDGDVTTDEDVSSDATAGDTSGSTDSDTTTAGDTTTAPTGWTSVVIYDKFTEPDCKATTSPGPDIDTVALWRQVGGTWTLMGVAKVGSCDYSAGVNPACPDNKHNAAADVAAACGPFGDIDAKDIATGYLGLGGGSVELKIGACQSDKEDISSCDGKGDAVEILAGDELDVYEVDQWYLSHGAGCGDDGEPKCATGKTYITGSCKCIPETYEVELRKEAGKSGTDDVILGEKTGTATLSVK